MLAESYFSQNRLADRLSAIADQMQKPGSGRLAVEHGTCVFTNHYTLNMTKLGALHASSLINTPARVAIYEWSLWRLFTEEKDAHDPYSSSFAFDKAGCAVF